MDNFRSGAPVCSHLASRHVTARARAFFRSAADSCHHRCAPGAFPTPRISVEIVRFCDV